MLPINYLHERMQWNNYNGNMLKPLPYAIDCTTESSCAPPPSRQSVRISLDDV